MLDQAKRLKDTVVSKVKSKKTSSRATERFIVGLDIGTENVKALIGKVKNDGSIEIVGVGRSHQELSDMQAGAIADISAVTANCDAALAQAEKMAGVGGRAVVIGIAGELVKGTTISVRVNRKLPEKALTIEEVEKMISLVQKRAFAKAKQQIAEELGGKEVDIRLVNSALVRLEIDGYVVTNPVGFQGKEVTIQLYTAFAPMIHIGALERVAHELDLDLLAVAAEPFAVARTVVGNNSNSSLSAVLMDVGGGTTDIAVVNEGGVQGTKMFGIGGRAFTKSIERDLNIDFSQAETLKLNLETSTVPPQKAESIEAALKKTLKVWRSGVELALSEFNTTDHIPHTLLLCGGGASLDMLTKELEQSDWYRDLPFTRKPSVQLIRPELAVGITDTTDSLNDHTFITAMGLLRVGTDTILQNIEESSENNTENSVSEKLNRLLRM
jgi:cell division protein FtsA